MKKIIILVFVYTVSLNVSAQEMWGISNSNFSGNMGIFLNPSTIVAAPYKYEFNLIAGDFFAQNTYIYIPHDQSLFSSGSNGITFLDIYNDKLQSGFGHALVIGPSFIRNKGNVAWGIHTAFRTEISAIDAPPSLAKFIFAKYKYQPLIHQSFSTAPFSAAWLGWGEIGGTYGRVLVDRQENFLKMAATLNLLLGFDGLYLDARKADYTIEDSATVIVHALDVTIGHALSASEKNSSGGFLTLRGFGLSTTIGATYIHGRRRGGYDCNATADNVRKYDYRLGVSLLDFGYINFSNQSQVMVAGTTTDRVWTHLDTVKFHSIVHLDDLLSENITGIRNTAVNKSFTMFLPTALGIQFDYSFTPHVYGNISIVNRIKYSPKEIARANQIDASLRYEKRKWELAGDFTLFEYKKPSFGVGFRYSIFVIGTDRLPQLFGLGDLQSFDLFFGFKLNLCDIQGKTKVSCPAFGNK